MRDRVVSFGDRLIRSVQKYAVRVIKTVRDRVPRRRKKVYVAVPTRGSVPNDDDPHSSCPRSGVAQKDCDCTCSEKGLI